MHADRHYRPKRSNDSYAQNEIIIINHQNFT